MRILKLETERKIAVLQQELTQKLASWTWPSGVDSDEIIVESIEAWWELKEIGKEEIRSPIRWLLSTARRLKLEKSRSVRARRAKPLPDNCAAPLNKSRVETSEVADSQALSALGPAKKFAITEILMFDRGVTEVARELGVKRSTVNGWICRLPKRLAQSPELQAFATRGY